MTCAILNTIDKLEDLLMFSKTFQSSFDKQQIKPKYRCSIIALHKWVSNIQR